MAVVDGHGGWPSYTNKMRDPIFSIFFHLHAFSLSNSKRPTVGGHLTPPGDCAHLAKGPSANHFLRDEEDEPLGVDGHGLLRRPRCDCVSQCIVVHKRVHRHGLASDGGNGVAPQRLLDGAAFIGAAVSADHGGLHDVLCDGAYEPIQRGAFHA